MALVCCFVEVNAAQLMRAGCSACQYLWAPGAAATKLARTSQRLPDARRQIHATEHVTAERLSDAQGSASHS